MRAVPAELAELRRLAAASHCLRRAGQPITDTDYQALSDRQQAECRWAPDQALLDRLTACERAHTASYRVAAA